MALCLPFVGIDNFVILLNFGVAHGWGKLRIKTNSVKLKLKPCLAIRYQNGMRLHWLAHSYSPKIIDVLYYELTYAIYKYTA